MSALRRLLPILLLAAIMGSCISNKRIVYVQDYSQKKPHNYLADTVFAAPPVDYRIQMGDILYFKSEHPELSRVFGGIDNAYMAETRVIQALPVLAGYTVDGEGFIELPIVGKVNVMGKTVFEAEQVIDAAASKVFADPAVRIFLLNFYVTVLGEVNRPGRYPVYNHRLTIFEALGLANDCTDFASREEVKVVRNRDGKNHLYHVDLTDQNILASEAFYMHPNDIIMVKPQKRKKYAARDVQNVYNAIGLAISAATLYLLITRN